MIFIYVTILVTLAIGAILFFPVYAVITAIVNNVEIPANMSGAWLNFIIANRNWYLFLFVIAPLLLWVFVQSQKPPRGIYQ